MVCSPPAAAAAARRRRLVWAAALAGYALLLRCFTLDAWVHVDVPWGWYAWVQSFWQALAARDWAATYQVEHVGVTFMWLTGGALRLAGLLEEPLSPATIVVAMAPLVLLSSLVIGASYLLLGRLLGGRHAWLPPTVGLLLASEPFMVGHARAFQLDMTLTGFTWLAALTSAVALRERSLRWSAGAGVLLGLAVLSKITAAGVAVGVALSFLVAALRPGAVRQRWRLVAGLCLLTACALATACALWPALWVEPRATVLRVYRAATSLVGAGHNMFSWGRIHASDAGVGLYLAVLLLRLTPELLLLALLYLASLGRWLSRAGRRAARAQGLDRRLWPLLLAYAPFVGSLVLSPKRIDRYLLPLIPPLALCAAAGAGMILQRGERGGALGAVPRWLLALALVLALGVRTGRIVQSWPHPVAWTSTLPGLDPEAVVTLGQGEGLKEVAQFIAGDARRRGRATPRLRLFVYHRCLRPWLSYDVAEFAQAEYIVTYLSLLQREVEKAEVQRYTTGRRPLFSVRLQGLVYAQVFAGPAYGPPSGAAARRALARP
ncbi:MAG: glycosyltransferase family 39 protein [Proteobacteria bacterium]|nr:glycosyltransferase family 39 protein [Pseudomonadota bacterium]